MRIPWQPVVIRATQCPRCQCPVYVPGQSCREHGSEVGQTRQCVQCAQVYAALHDGRVISFIGRGSGQSVTAQPGSAAPGVRDGRTPEEDLEYLLP